MGSPWGAEAVRLGAATIAPVAAGRCSPRSTCRRSAVPSAADLRDGTCNGRPADGTLAVGPLVVIGGPLPRPRPAPTVAHDPMGVPRLSAVKLGIPRAGLTTPNGRGCTPPRWPRTRKLARSPLLLRGTNCQPASPLGGVPLRPIPAPDPAPVVPLGTAHSHPSGHLWRRVHHHALQA